MNGRNRKVTDEQVRRLREWVPLTQLCRQMGISPKTGVNIRSGYRHKKPSP